MAQRRERRVRRERREREEREERDEKSMKMEREFLNINMKNENRIQVRENR